MSHRRLATIWLAVLVCALSACTVTYAPVIDKYGADYKRGPVTRGVHVVREGETLYSIAWRYGWDFKALASANRIGAPYTIYPGQEIRLDRPQWPALHRVLRRNRRHHPARPRPANPLPVNHQSRPPAHRHRNRQPLHRPGRSTGSGRPPAAFSVIILPTRSGSMASPLGGAKVIRWRQQQTVSWCIVATD